MYKYTLCFNNDRAFAVEVESPICAGDIIVNEGQEYLAEIAINAKESRDLGAVYLCST